jgi:signal peptidase I
MSDTDQIVAPEQETTSTARWLIETALLVLLAFALAQGIKMFIVQPFVIPTGSMEPTIAIGNRVLAEKLSYTKLFGKTPSYGDIVVFDDPAGQHPQLIKRVIAVGGQTVDVKDGAVWVDGQRLVEPYTHGQPNEPGTVRLPMRIPQGYVWLMGDNRTNSGDSRFFGPVPVDRIRGHAVWTYWPPKAFGQLQ